MRCELGSFDQQAKIPTLPLKIVARKDVNLILHQFIYIYILLEISHFDTLDTFYYKMYYFK